MPRKLTNFSLTLEQLAGWDAGSADDARADMVESLIRSWKKPLRDLSDEEIGDLVVQHDGYPFVLDLVWTKLELDPLFKGGRYPGALLSMLIQAGEEIWVERPDYHAQLGALYGRALARPSEENEMFRESLNLPSTDSPSH